MIYTGIVLDKPCCSSGDNTLPGNIHVSEDKVVHAQPAENPETDQLKSASIFDVEPETWFGSAADCDTPNPRYMVSDTIKPFSVKGWIVEKEANLKKHAEAVELLASKKVVSECSLIEPKFSLDLVGVEDVTRVSHSVVITEEEEELVAPNCPVSCKHMRWHPSLPS
jgi:hypothetical protein